RLPIALGCPVRLNGPHPDLPIWPVARCRLMIALEVNVPASVWLTPIVQNVISRLDSITMRPASIRSARPRPQISATRSNGPDRQAGLRAIQPHRTAQCDGGSRLRLYEPHAPRTALRRRRERPGADGTVLGASFRAD